MDNKEMKETMKETKEEKEGNKVKEPEHTRGLLLSQTNWLDFTTLTVRAPSHNLGAGGRSGDRGGRSGDGGGGSVEGGKAGEGGDGAGG